MGPIPERKPHLLAVDGEDRSDAQPHLTIVAGVEDDPAALHVENDADVLAIGAESDAPRIPAIGEIGEDPYEGGLDGAMGTP